MLPVIAIAHLVLNNSYFKKATLLKHNSTILIGQRAKLNIVVKIGGEIMPEGKFANRAESKAASAAPAIDWRKMTCKDCSIFTPMGKSGQGYCRKLASKKSTTSKACKDFKKK